MGRLVFDDNGTPTDGSDDKSHFFSSFSNASGTSLDVSEYYCLAEDRKGDIWVGTNHGPIVCSSAINALRDPARCYWNGIIRNEQVVQQLIDLAGGKPVYFVTIRMPYPNQEKNNNSMMRAAASHNGNVGIIDWYKYSEGHGEYLYDDGIHPIQKALGLRAEAELSPEPDELFFFFVILYLILEIRDHDMGSMTEKYMSRAKTTDTGSQNKYMFQSYTSHEW